MTFADKATIPKTNIVLTDISRDTQLRLHTLSTYSQLMVLRFDLNGPETCAGSATTSGASNTETKKKDKFIDLVALKYGENGVLEMTPDFTYNKKPYRVEVRWLKAVSFCKSIMYLFSP